MKKRIPTGVAHAAATFDLEPDEDLVTTETVTKTVGRRKAKPEPEPVDATPIEDTIGNQEFVTIDAEEYGSDDEDSDRPSFSPDSLAALLYGEDEDNIESKFCTVMVRREPDDLRDQFLVPCNKQMRLPRLGGISLTASRSDIEDRVRDEHGSGGTFTFQLHVNGSLGPSWTATLADDPRKIREAQQPAAAPVYAPPPPSEPVNPLRQRIEELKLEKEYDDLKFGAERRRLERLEAELDELRKRRESGETVPQSDLAVAVSLLKGNTDPGILDFVKDALNPPEKESGTNVWDVAKYVLEHADTIMPVAMSVLSGFMGRPPQPMPPPMYQQQPPPAMEPPPLLPNTPLFGRRKSTPEDADTETLGNEVTEPAAEPIEAEPATETE